MKKVFCAALLGVAVSFQGQTKAQGRPLPLSEPRPSAATLEEWGGRKFGMFIHFGLYSELGGVWKGKPVDNGYSEQIMGNAPIPLDEYAAVAKRFDPEKWDPDAVVALAKAAGMRFIVITSKHHDGFSMFHTAQSKYNVVDATPYKRDVVKELADACRRGGMKFGVYYSSIDWHEPGMDHYIEGNSNPLSDAHAKFNVAQLKELLGGTYGPLSEIWFDMGKPTPAQSKLFAETVHTLQPQTMVSGRVFNYQGDFTVMGDNEVPEYGIDEPWQTPASIFGATWGYRSWQKRDDVQGKIQENIVRLVQVVSRGGNYILNIGPEGDGSVVPYEAEVLRGVGAWLKPTGEAIYGTKASPFPDLDFGYVTLGDHAVYLFVKNDGAPLRLPGGSGTQWTGATLLGDHHALKIFPEGADTVVQKPADWFHGFLPVVKLTYRGPLRVTKPKIAAETDGSYRLTAQNAEKFYNYNGFGYEDPKTLYKMRWEIAAGCYAATFKTAGSGAAALVAKGAARTVSVADGTVVKVEVGTDATFEITPKEPFLKGTALPLKVEVVLMTPCK
ncbi:alpha-L-fucosidase [Terriglobus saanensis]|uniref:alpha-L-fucosidase n=1 Tax=Terriglobus saanensis (strain ATCC BAA-1853 / DSM 23119 / SP1PR4) TaxID=401053 RepID=E8V216_TERSS|nr:alpha-L-fucosidase [Terriglobus saanensis]ADV84573.1 glycoside hydrolase family 29 (alpha-L-fucosidase) [Terriglobus saanensis SP1PR4]